MMIELRVARPDGGQQTIGIDSADEPAAVRAAVARGYRVLSVGIAPPAKASSAQAGRFSVVLFSQELLALLEAGLTLVEALEALRGKESGTGGAAILDGLLAELKRGKRFSDALAARPDQFAELYVATIRASEVSGNLPEALARYVAYRVQFEAIRKKAVSASIYPLMLLAVGAMVTLFLMGYVVPRFSAVYESAGRDTPWLSAALLTAGRFIHEHWMQAAGAFVLFAAGLVLAARTPALRARVLSLALRLPALGRRAAEFRLARFYRTAALLLNAGIPLTRAMGMCEGLFAAHEIVRAQSARRAVEEGSTFSEALDRAGLVTPIALSLIRVGERSGRLAEMLDRAARFHDEEFARWMEWTARLLEPVLMTAIGIVIGGVVVLLYMPIFDLAGSLQ